MRPLPATMKVRRDPKCYGGGALEHTDGDDGVVFVRIDIVEALAEMLRAAPLESPSTAYVKDYCKALTAYHEAVGDDRKWEYP